jgi:hypothetical protein
MQLLQLQPNRRAQALERLVRAAGVAIIAAAGLGLTGGLAGAATPPPVSPGTTSPAPASPGRVTASLTGCHVAGDLPDRYATFAAQMVATSQTEEMSLRLQLYEHTAAAPGYHVVTGVPGFGVWESSAPGIGVFNYSQEVTSLIAPASFRVQVGYRWLDAGRHVIKRATRTTMACVEPAELANLVAGSLSIVPGTAAGTATYDLTVRNTGVADVGPFDVSLSIDGTTPTEQSVSGLAAGERTIVEFTGPACASGGTIAVVVDPENAIQESTKVDDSRTVACK